MRVSMRFGLSAYLFLSFFILLSRGGPAETGERKGHIVGASHVNLRSGPGVSHPPIAILKSGEEVDVEALETGWYRVSLPDGRKGYVYEEFVRLPETEESKTHPAAALAETAQEARLTGQALPTERNGSKERGSQVVAPQVGFPAPTPIERHNPKPNMPPPVTTVRAALRQIGKWFLVGLAIFTLGWILGGNYYLRRDYIRRTKLRF